MIRRSISLAPHDLPTRVSFPFISRRLRTVDMAHHNIALQRRPSRAHGAFQVYSVTQFQSPQVVRRIVSAMTSAVKELSFMLVTVRHTPLTAMLSPILLPSSAIDAPITILFIRHQDA